MNIIELKPIYLFSAHANLFECVYPGSVPCAHKEKVPANSEQNKYKHPAPNLKGKKGRDIVLNKVQASVIVLLLCCYSISRFFQKL